MMCDVRESMLSVHEAVTGVAVAADHGVLLEDMLHAEAS